jgi:hypothetical protein
LVGLAYFLVERWVTCRGLGGLARARGDFPVARRGAVEDGWLVEYPPGPYAAMPSVAGECAWHGVQESREKLYGRVMYVVPEWSAQDRGFYRGVWS